MGHRRPLSCPSMHADLALALELADVADALNLERFRASDLRVDTKPDSSPVTDADTRTEAALRERLLRQRPAHAIVGEEYGSDGESEWRWFIDPIDGTKNFARGVPVWATLIGLRRGDDGVCGVVSAPALHRRWYATRGGGAWSAPDTALRVSSVTDLSAAHMSCTDIRDFDSRGLGDGFRSLTAACRFVRAFGDFWSHVLVAEGALDIGVEPVVNPWDLAALQVIVEEAGGRFTDLDGRPRIDGGSALTSNGLLHDTALARLRNR